jgi:molecular chaperone DnaK (HSP70)
MSYATKEELAEVKSMIEEIKAMIKDKEDMAAVESKVREELSSTPAAAPLKHNPEGNVQTKKVTFGQNRPQSIQDRVFARIANIQK